MSQRKKLLAEVRQNPANVSLKKLERLLCLYGFEERVPAKKHHVYKRPGCRPLTIPFARPVKEVYVKQVIAAIEACGADDEQIAE